MALHPKFPSSPYEILAPELRWFPAAEELRSTAYEKLLPPLVAAIREEVKAWRDTNYSGASPTSRALLSWWFETGHLIEQADGAPAMMMELVPGDTLKLRLFRQLLYSEFSLAQK